MAFLFTWSTILLLVKQISRTKLNPERILKPDGWVQMVECYYMCQSDNGSITESHALRQWSNKYIRSMDGTKDPRAPLQIQNMLTAAGFVNIECTMIPLPLCGWSTGT